MMEYIPLMYLLWIQKILPLKSGAHLKMEAAL